MTRAATSRYPLRKITGVVGRTKGWSAEYALECGHTKWAYYSERPANRMRCRECPPNDENSVQGPRAWWCAP